MSRAGFAGGDEDRVRQIAEQAQLIPDVIQPDDLVGTLQGQ